MLLAKHRIMGSVIVASIFLTSGLSHAQMEKSVEESPLSAAINIQADTFFGCNPQVMARYSLTENLAFALNSTYWTDVQGLGINKATPWLEVDVGVNWTLLNKQLSITPMLGTVHGHLLSSRGGAFPRGGGSRNERSTAFEGIVPNITANWVSERLEGQFYMG